jgi:hypothetical protein
VGGPFGFVGAPLPVSAMPRTKLRCRTRAQSLSRSCTRSGRQASARGSCTHPR